MRPDPKEAFVEAQPWERETLIQRAEKCRVYLRVRGLLGDAENAKIKARMDKWFAAAKEERDAHR